MLDAVVVGAGHAGLAVSWHLTRLGVRHVVLEQATIGDSWRTTRWDSFRLNTPAWANRLPGEPPLTDDRGAFHARDEWADHLAAYARQHGLPVEEGSPVSRLGRAADEVAYQLQVGGDAPRTLVARCVVVASGMQRVPRLPPMAASLPASVRSMHAAAYRSPSGLPPGGVLVVGGAQSGCQVAEDLLEAGRPVWLAASAAPRMPRRYRGRDIFEWLGEVGFFDETLADLPDPVMRWWPQPNVSGIGPGGRTLSLQAVRAGGATLTGRLSGVEGAVVRFAPDLGDCIRRGDVTSVRTRQRIDVHISERGIVAPRPEPDEADRPIEAPEASPGPASLDLIAAGIGSVIWATGFGPDLSWIDLGLPMERGLPTHVQGEAIVQGEAMPGLWFLGIPWMRHRSSGIILGADRDGAFVADRVKAALA